MAFRCARQKKRGNSFVKCGCNWEEFCSGKSRFTMRGMQQMCYLTVTCKQGTPSGNGTIRMKQRATVRRFDHSAIQHAPLDDARGRWDRHSRHAHGWPRRQNEQRSGLAERCGQGRKIRRAFGKRSASRVLLGRLAIGPCEAVMDGTKNRKNPCFSNFFRGSCVKNSRKRGLSSKGPQYPLEWDP
jgi:hypothetical protein